jgi:hypothetical protein
LSVLSRVETTIIDGQVYFDRQADSARRQALEQEKRALLDKERGTTPERPRVTTTEALP